MTDRELMQQALEALETITSCPEPMSYFCSFAVEIEALRARLAQPEFIWTELSEKDAAELKAAITAEGRKPNKQEEAVIWKFPREPKSAGGWIIDYSLIRNIRSVMESTGQDFPAGYEEIESTLLALEEIYAAPSQQKDEA